ncbi:MAG: hypothetical protein GY930_16875 [bacterium]|nr:hypothetical protein [bacterium]
MLLNLFYLLPLIVGGVSILADAPAEDHSVVLTDDGRGTPYVVDKTDSICGLSEPRQLTVPAKVNFEKLLKATAEHKELVRKKIDPSSAKGTALLSRATRKVVAACEAVRVKGSYCSIWKTISRRDGVAIPSVTADVLKKL